jgi:hypothetical protein
MPRKVRSAKVPHGLTDYRVAELLSLQRPLIPTEGYCRREDGRYVADEVAIRAAWQRLDAALVQLWIGGWAPSVRFLVPEAKEPGMPGTRPAGWWKYCAPDRRRRGESQIAYLRRHNLLVEGEEELVEQHARRTATVRGLMMGA